ncbi:MAG: putative Ig domain-containing protein [Verrucomicrobiaceae bacterium]|nr:putative Ig domain-containing protein [Verrucomicrobiaceae bacterium]
MNCLSPISRASALIACLLAITPFRADASIAYGSINNFDTVNDTGHECHGFEIELDDCHSTDITYTYNYNHYGVPEITEDKTDPAHPKCFIKWQSKKNANGTWAAYTAIPSGPIAPTNGHMFTNPAVNFGGEHFGVGYKVQPSAVHYNWLIDNGSGTLVHGGAVQVSTPTFTYYPPVAAQPAQVVAVIAPPPPPAPPVKQFGKAVWVKEIKTTTHNPEKIKLRELVSDDPADPNDKNWKKGEPDEVEVEWRILQKKNVVGDPGPNAELAGAPEDLPGGDEVVTRRYEFYKYTGPLDAESGEAMADAVGADDLHGTGMRTYNDHMVGGEWVTVTNDMANFEIVGEFTGSQMAAVDVNEPVGLIDHVGEGKVNKAIAPRAVVVEGALPFTCTHDGTVPPGLSFNDATGILSGTPTTSGQYKFTVTASDGINPDVQKNYTMSIAAVNAALPAQSLLDTAASPVGTGTTTGDGSYAPGTNATVTATPAPGYKFLNWTDNAQVVSTNTSYTLAMDVNHSLVANFAPDVMQWNITTAAAPVAGGTTTGAGLYDDASNVTVVATPNAGYTFTNWTETGAPVSNSASYTFAAGIDRDLVANFTALPTYTIGTSAAPVAGGTTTGDGSFVSGTNATLTATPNAGFFFVNWTVNGTQVSTNASYTFAVTANQTLVANFSVIGATLRTISTSSSPVAGGTLSGAGVYADGSSVTVTATPAQGYEFAKWKIGGTQVSLDPSYTFTASANVTLTASFNRVYYVTADVFPAVGGTTETDSSSYKLNENARVDAFPNAGYEFVGWSENGVVFSADNPISFKVAADRTIVANFALIGGVNINTASAPVAGGDALGAGSYLIGDSVTVSAIPNPGYAFTNWTQGATIVSSSADYTFTATASRSLVANFVQVVQFNIATSAAPALGGSVTGAGIYNSGSNVTLTATPAVGYVFTHWTNGATVVSSNPVYAFPAAASATLVAHFAEGVEILTDVSPPGAGLTTGDGSIPSGTSTTLTATANAGFTFLNWTDGLGNIVSTNASYTFTPTASDTFIANFEAPVVGVHFDFDTGTPLLALHAPMPLAQTSGGITATFSTPNANPPSIENAGSTSYTLSKFSGKYLAPSNDTGTVVEVAFDMQLTGVELTFATVEALNVAVPSDVQVTAYDNSSGQPVLVGTAIAHGTVTPGDSLPSGKLTFNSANGPFDTIRIELPSLPAGAQKFLIDDIVVSPGGNFGGSLTLSNPNWNITLTDFGYSDFLLDNTPGFVGREYLSGEWGSAVAYTRSNGNTVSPKWMEPNFMFPDWKTNSDFHVVEGIHLVGTNLDGLPIARSIIANNDLEVTLRFEMVDTVTGTPMGVTQASGAGAPKSVNSNRYVMNQTFTVKNISGGSVSNVQLFQLLHGFTSQRGVYDNRSYAGKLSPYQYDATLAGVDQTSVGADGASTTGLEDYIAFHSKVAPTAFEIGAYGTEGNGIDDHSVGKPSDGVHLSIENNWQSAPFLARKNRDYFAPANRWVSGGQRWDLGTIADGQSLNFDIVLSLLTGTTVTITGGGNGNNTGGGSCNGGSQHVGGLDFEFEDINTEGTFFGEFTEADDLELQEREDDGEFLLPTFDTPNGTVTQLWNLTYSGTHNGRIKLVFHYDATLLPPGYDESKLTIRHFTNGAWEQLVGRVDTVNDTITVTTASLSPFALATPTANAIPKITQTVTAPGTLQLQWTSDTTGWVLQQSPDLATWTNSTAVINTVGNVSTVTINSAGGMTFYRLAHP